MCCDFNICRIVGIIGVCCYCCVCYGFLHGYLRFARFLTLAFVVVSYVGICACARFLRFARGFDVNDRQLAVNASQLFLGLLCSLWSSMLCGYGAQWSLMVLPQPQGAASLALG